MTESFVHLFDTPLGRCGIGWSDAGIIAASFPEASDGETISRMRKQAAEAEVSDAVPADIRSAIDEIIALMEGESRDLLKVDVNLAAVSGFERSVYDLTRRILPGKTRTYGDLAKDLGDVAFSQQVGQALGRNPVPIIIPCHRVVGADGKMTGFSAPGGVETKRRLLKIEGAIDRDLFDLID